MRNSEYKPNAQSFASGLKEGTSILECKSHRGRTARERGKQAQRFQRIRDRSHKDRENQGKAK